MGNDHSTQMLSEFTSAEQVTSRKGTSIFTNGVQISNSQY